jgi:MoaA/NifB/PqqE/SkfB family radical SAM enzyme
MLKEVSIEIIRRCANNCVHCSSLSGEHCSEIFEYDLFVSVVTDAARLGAKTICISGGEPFLHHRIVDMIMFVSSLGLQSYVYTSGIILDARNNKVSLNRDTLKAIYGKVTKLIFNVEAASPETYNSIMETEGCFEKMKQSILDANSFSIITEAHFVPMRLNINEIEETVVLCKELGVAKISFLRLVLHGRARLFESKIALSADEFLRLKSSLESLRKNAGIDIRIGVPLSSNVSCHKCEADGGKLNIKYDGYVFPCEVFKNDRAGVQLKGLKPGNIHNCSLYEIYNDSLYLKYVRDYSRSYNRGKYGEACIGQHLISKRENETETWRRGAFSVNLPG